MLDMILLISNSLTRSPEGVVKLSEIEKRTGVDRRTLRKWLTGFLIAQKYSPAFEPLSKDSFDRKADAKFTKNHLSQKLLELFLESHPIGQIELEKADDALTSVLFRAKLLKMAERRDRQYLEFTHKGLELAIELRDLLNTFYSKLFDLNWMDTFETKAIGKELETAIGRIEFQITLMYERELAEEREKMGEALIRHFPIDNVVEIIDESIREVQSWQ